MFGVPTFMMPVLYSPIIDEFGWSRTQVTLIATMKFGAGAVIGLLFGVLLDRMSIRKIVLFAGALSGLAMISFLAIQSLATYYLIGLGLGLGAVGVMIAMKVLVSRRFRKQQGFAMGAALIGTSVAGTLTPVVAVYLIEMIGWRETAAVMSAGIWFIALPAFLWIVKDEDFEETLDKDRGKRADTGNFFRHLERAELSDASDRRRAHRLRGSGGLPEFRALH